MMKLLNKTETAVYVIYISYIRKTLYRMATYSTAMRHKVVMQHLVGCLPGKYSKIGCVLKVFTVRCSISFKETDRNTMLTTMDHDHAK